MGDDLDDNDNDDVGNDDDDVHDNNTSDDADDDDDADEDDDDDDDYNNDDDGVDDYNGDDGDDDDILKKNCSPMKKLGRSVIYHGDVKIDENQSSNLCSSSMPDCSPVVSLLSLKYQRWRRVKHPFAACCNILSLPPFRY